ncbi:hypothetical protein QYE76_033382 [Lolium multiflorum]|uniref:Reverse transcriptase domain-containing protein n=1 Tax=Lolium multiflorum TaxID=4521 RepID=A0AAD8VK96_LOLMU|nr:hypothetical protein QYE76_033382 [Lolium multiflorum]
MDIFAWQPSDMSGLPRQLVEHYLNINPGSTYQRTMQRCLKDQIGRNVHAYVDDIAVMTRKGSDLISDLTETFENLRRYKMMLNPLKCVFGVPAGKLLGFIVSHRGIEGSRKLRHYFQEHLVTVVSKAPLSTIIKNSDATGRVAKWGIEHSAFDINYEARTMIKSQVLADFIADWTEAPEGTPVPEPEAWVMHFDESKQHQGSGAGVTLKSPTGEELQDEVDEIAKCFLGYEVKYVRIDNNTTADMLSKLGSGRNQFRLESSWSTYGYPR